MSKQRKEAEKGRPKGEPAKAFTCRHVVNISPEMDAAVKKFREASLLARDTDALRVLIHRALRAEGLL